MRFLFVADSITRSFGSTQVLKTASLWASAGRVTALFGRNGGGKTTLLRIGAGLLRADQGTVHFAGRVHLQPRLADLAAEGLFYLPDRDLLSTRLTLRQQIQAAEWHFGTDRTAGILECLELTGRLDQRPKELSGGERRRAEVALAWICRPRCLLADEPFTEIDPADRERIARVFSELARNGCALVITGHEVPQLLEIADDVVWLTAGTTHALGTPEEAIAHHQFRREYLGTAGPASLKQRRG